MLHPNVAADRPMGETGTGHRAGGFVAIAVGVVLLAIAVSVDFPRASVGFKGDEATYYMLGHSLARDGDFTYERRDLIRVWEEYHAPEGVFLKRGKTLRLAFGGGFPFVHRIKADDPVSTRLYFGKAYIYPLTAAPFVWAFGTNGFLVLHALLLALDLWLGYLWLAARGSGRRAASVFVLVFLIASVTPVYFVWLTPEILNFSLALIAVFLWTYKEVAPGAGRFLAGPGSDFAAAVLIGVLTYSKPTHAPLIAPVVLLAAARGQWWRTLVAGTLFVLVAGGLFGLNAAITGEFNYQGGYRKTFYSSTGFPFANERETFDNTAPIHGRSEVQEEILVNRHTFEVLRRNLVYFVFGRHSGLLPYFFPGVVAFALFAVRRRARFAWQWLLVGAMVVEVFALLFITPYTWAGGGGPIGNRYFLSFYPLFLFLMPPVSSLGPALAALVVGAAFTAKIVFDPFWSSYNYANHAKAGPLRVLPIELTMLNDLPVAANPDRSRRRLRGGVLAYFPDDNAYTPEGDMFWVRGKRRADVILRAPLEAAPDGRWMTREIERLQIDVRNAIRRNVVTIDTGAGREVLEMAPGESRTITLPMPRGVPYRPYETPTSFVYVVTFRTTAGFVPFLETPPSSDARFLGAAVTVTPVLR
ncbi:MAG TPA: hypothetical protein VK886_09845 [Vicinamibacterales bacterium]|nr:hypothetical protein [Vicinamibacterales bacterium]